MKVSFLIITWNGLELLKGCLSTLSTYLNRNDVEVIIVDNGSQDGTVEYLKTEHPTIRLIELSTNKGVAAARNKALKIAKGDYLFIIDNDLLMNDEAVEGMLKYMDSHTEVGLCGCRLLDANGYVQPSAKQYPGVAYKLKNLLFSGKYNYSYDLLSANEPLEPVYLIGACQLVRREAFLAVGYLDEHIFYGPEDADFCIRMKQEGWRVIYLPQYEMIHFCQRVTNRRFFSRMGWRHVKGLLYFYWKHKSING